MKGISLIENLIEADNIKTTNGFFWKKDVDRLYQEELNNLLGIRK